LRDFLSLYRMFVCIFFEFHNSATAYIFHCSHFYTSTNYSQQEVS